jgi:hypothetical protein
MAKSAKSAENPLGPGVEAPEARVDAAPEAPRGRLREFVAEVNCIYQGRYTYAGTKVFSEAKEIPHFRAV